MKVPALLLCLPLLTLMPSCDKSDGDQAESKDDAKAKAAKPPSPPPSDAPKASCSSVLMTKAVTDAAASLTMTVDGKPFDIALDPKAEYEKNPVWDAGSAPASCGNIQPRSQGGKGLVYIAQLNQGGKPVLRLQMTGLPGGKTELKGSGVTGMALVDGDKAHAVSFTAGNITAPDELAEGTIELRIEGAKGSLVGDPSHEFTLEGTIKGTFGELTY